MIKTQVYLREEELDALHRAARRSGRSVADLVREAVRRVWLRPEGEGPVALWDGPAKRTSVAICTDAASFAIMKRCKIRRAFAFDHHFASAGFRLVG